MKYEMLKDFIAITYQNKLRLHARESIYIITYPGRDYVITGIDGNKDFDLKDVKYIVDTWLIDFALSLIKE